MLHYCLWAILGMYCIAPIGILLFDYINDLLDLGVSRECVKRTMANYMLLVFVAPISVPLMVVLLVCRLFAYVVILLLYVLVQVYKLIRREKK